jgi:hypothetical protein
MGIGHSLDHTEGENISRLVNKARSAIPLFLCD